MSKAVYCIGDIHGYGYLLTRLQDLIVQDANEHLYDDCTIVYVGDYVDRGLQSKQVIDHLISVPMEQKGFKSIHLKGNHEDLFLEFMENPNRDRLTWLSNGGQETCRSYGVDLTRHNRENSSFEEMAADLASLVPEEHKKFLKSLKIYHLETLGDEKYLFVHAGIRPGVPLDQQRPEEMMWIRHLFLNSPVDHGYRVVHGHTPNKEPEVYANRINVDTGVFYTGRLTAVVLEEGIAQRFLFAT